MGFGFGVRFWVQSLESGAPTPGDVRVVQSHSSPGFDWVLIEGEAGHALRCASSAAERSTFSAFDVVARVRIRVTVKIRVKASVRGLQFPSGGA